MLHVHTNDIDLAIQTVRDIYCPHRLSFDREARRIETLVDVSGLETWPLVRLRYGAAVQVDAGDFPDLFLIMKCIGGTGTMQQGNRASSWEPGAVVPMSANLDTRFSFSRDFSQISVKPNKRRLEVLCSRWLGHPLEEELQFALQPFSPSMEYAWSSALSMIDSHGAMRNALPAAAEAALEEYVLTLLLQGHPHNYSAELSSPDQRPQSRLVRRAERYIAENASSPITVSSVAATLGTSVRALQLRFREERSMTPLEYLRAIRLERVHTAIVNADSSTTVTELALAHGFTHLGRFSESYRARFDESPMATLRRTRSRTKKGRSVSISN